MPEKLLRLTPKQRSRCNRLICRLCANYDDGNCLLLDDGEICVCPQTISYSLLCKYFKAAVLPADKELEADIYGSSKKRCKQCGDLYASAARTQQYCEKCAAKRKQQKAAERQRKKRASRSRF